MDFKKLKYFLTVVEKGNITKAAEALYISQSPLSHQLKIFEQELGVQLFQKARHTIKLTDYGQLLYERGSAILAMVEQTNAEIKAMKEVSQETLFIGNATPWGFINLPQHIQKFTAKYPQCSFRLQQGDSHYIMELLQKGKIEFGLITFPASLQKYESKLISIEPVCAFFEDKHDFGIQPQYITLKEIGEADVPLIMHSDSYELITTYYRHIGVEPKMICQHNDSLLVDWKSDEPYILLGSKSIFELFPRRNIKCKRIVEPVYEEVDYIVWRRHYALPKAARTFIDMLLASCKPPEKVPNAELYNIIGQPDRLEKIALS